MKIGLKDRYAITHNEIMMFARDMLTWLDAKSNTYMSDYMLENEIYREDMQYFIDRYSDFYDLIKKAEEKQRRNVEQCIASGILKPSAFQITQQRQYISTKDQSDEKEKRSNRFGLTQIDYEFVMLYNETNDRISAAQKVNKKYRMMDLQEADALNWAESTLRKRETIALQKHINEKALAANKITKSRILQEISWIAFADPRDYFDREGRVINPSQLTKEQASAIKRIKTIERQDGSVSTELELISKLSALTELDKHAGLYDDPLEDEAGASSKRPAIQVTFKRFDGNLNVNTQVPEPIEDDTDKLREVEDVEGEILHDELPPQDDENLDGFDL